MQANNQADKRGSVRISRHSDMGPDVLEWLRMLACCGRGHPVGGGFFFRARSFDKDRARSALLEGQQGVSASVLADAEILPEEK